MGHGVATAGGGPSAAVEGGHAGAPVGDPGAAADGGGAPDSDPVVAEDDQAGAAAVGIQGTTTAVSSDAARDMAPGSGHGADVGSPASLGMDVASGVLPASSAWLEGLDPNSSYLLKIRLFGNQKTARKEIKCFCFDKAIDSELTNYKDFVESIVEEYPPHYLEVAHVQYYDDVLKIFPEVKSDQELVSMFEKHSKTKVVQMFIAYYDGHNWMYPVCFGVFDSETNENWIWFMQLLRHAIGSPKGLAICTDAGQVVMTGVKEVFPEAEHRECMFHLVSNFKKKFHGKVFDDHLWAAAYSWNPYLFDKHWIAMEATKPAATAYLRKWHNRLWSRSQFLTICKVDYVTNNLAECFNKWIKHHKSLNLDDFMDKARQLIMIKWNERRKVAKKLDGLILPHIIKKLNAMTRELNLEVVECSEEVAEVTALGGSGFSDAHIKNYVDLYYSIDKFRAAYAQLIPAMPDKTQWPKSDHGFFMHPPLLKATAGRTKTERYKGCAGKKSKKGKHLCPICKDYGHHWHNCKKGNPDDIAAMLAVGC
ncbi:hypothetical protein ACQ4PT_020159 [Festuca glaucescens]